MCLLPLLLPLLLCLLLLLLPLLLLPLLLWLQLLLLWQVLEPTGARHSAVRGSESIIRCGCCAGSVSRVGRCPVNMLAAT